LVAEVRTRGFSLGEILVALGVLSIGILGICSTLALGTRAEGEAQRITEATAYTREIIDLIRSRNLDFAAWPGLPSRASGINDGPDARQALNAAPFAADLPKGTPYHRNVRIERMPVASTDYRAAIVIITATVTWFEGGQEHSTTFQAYHRQP
jgi:type II secretory pathway pseudopilin PulG